MAKKTEKTVKRKRTAKPVIEKPAAVDDDQVESNRLSEVKPYKLKSERSLKERVFAWLFPGRLVDEVVVNMELANGVHETFIVDGNKEFFIFKDGLYIIDSQLKYWNATLARFALDYNQNFSNPLRREWDVDGLKDAIVETYNARGEQFTITSTNPRNLKIFVNSKVIEGVMRGQQLQEFIKRWNLAFLILIVLTVIHLIVYLNQSGALKGLKFW